MQLDVYTHLNNPVNVLDPIHYTIYLEHCYWLGITLLYQGPNTHAQEAGGPSLIYRSCVGCQSLHNLPVCCLFVMLFSLKVTSVYVFYLSYAQFDFAYLRRAYLNIYFITDKAYYVSSHLHYISICM